MAQRKSLNLISGKHYHNKNMDKMSWAFLEQVSVKEMMQLHMYSKFKEITMREEGVEKETLDEDGHRIIQTFERKLTSLMRNSKV